ncbi:hypothetical protein Egran_02313 [Elaphomyces granulatus]|uniref:B30.2/SPRY domain-containing protein n=1 Tax=Elaphomyces granulatus TaxID=519963 RepID=A0A232M0S5_9EURO|nr:hypothetical protein Egran_02313 [Elaphomyces granulatus]
MWDKTYDTYDGCSRILEQQGIAQKTSRWEQESWAYHGDDGKSFFGENQGRGREYGPTFTTNDIVGYGVNFSTGCAFFTRNGVLLGGLGELNAAMVFCHHPNVKLYSSVAAFMFDIDGIVKEERVAVLQCY